MSQPTRSSIVPFANWGVKRREGDGPLQAIARRAGARFFRSIEDLLDEDLEARISRIPTHFNEVGFDPFGWDPDTARYALAVAALLHRRYFRTIVHGLDNVPERGPLLVIANHSGQVPVDGLVIGAALMMDAEPPRLPRSMVEKWSAQLPFVSVFFQRCGQVVGSPDNARRLLEQGETLVVFPEGAQGISKTFDRRYQMVDFGLGFMRLALETQTPILPVGVIGGEEQYVSVADLKPLARLLGMPAFPIIPQVFLGMLAPLPTRYRLYLGEPLRFDGDPDDDDAVIEEKVWVVRATIQSMLNRGLKERKHVFF
ncbi:MAG: lysophospholipid acyltransferase family protein [Polyangiales bacterium]